MDEGSADREDFVVGDVYEVIGVAGQEPFTLVGLTRFGDENALAGATLMSFPMDELQRLEDVEGNIEWIDVAGEDGLERDLLLDRIKSLES
jgi:putative ABC transport system permease protein